MEITPEKIIQGKECLEDEVIHILQQKSLMKKLIPEVWLCHRTRSLKHVLDGCKESEIKINMDEYN